LSTSTDTRSILSKLNRSPKLVVSFITAFSFLIIGSGLYLVWFSQKDLKENVIITPLLQPKSKQTPSPNPDPTLKQDPKLLEQELKLPTQDLNSQFFPTPEQRYQQRKRKTQQQQVEQRQPEVRQPEVRQPEARPQERAAQQPSNSGSGKAGK